MSDEALVMYLLKRERDDIAAVLDDHPNSLRNESWRLALAAVNAAIARRTPHWWCLPDDGNLCAMNEAAWGVIGPGPWPR